MSQRKGSWSAVALLTLAGGLLAAAPALGSLDEATAAERTDVDPGNKAITRQGLRPGGEGAIILQKKKTQGIILQKGKTHGIIIHKKK